MKRNILSLLISCLVLLSFTSSIVFAEKNVTLANYDEKIVEVMDLGDVIIEVLEDGRINPVKEVQNLDEKKINKVLRKMGYLDQELEKMNMELKREIAYYGGKKVKLKLEKKTHNFHDGNGNIYTDLPYAYSELDGISLSNSLNNDVGTLGVVDGSFTGDSYVSYLGKTTNGVEFRYRYFQTYKYNDFVYYQYSDKFAMAWDSKATVVAGTTTKEAYYRDWNSGALTTGSISIDKTEVAGTTWKTNIYKSNYHYGKGSEEVRIPVSKAGETAAFESSHAHPWSPIDVRPSIGPLSIDWDWFLGDEWTWRYSFTITN